LRSAAKDSTRANNGEKKLKSLDIHRIHRVLVCINQKPMPPLPLRVKQKIPFNTIIGKTFSRRIDSQSQCVGGVEARRSL
jgi:hypothetical protein